MHNFPQYCIIQQRENTDGKRNNKKGCTQQNEINDFVGFLLMFFFCSFLKQQVSEHTRLFSDGHKKHFNGFSTALSWLGIKPHDLQNFLIE